MGFIQQFLPLRCIHNLSRHRGNGMLSTGGSWGLTAPGTYGYYEYFFGGPFCLFYYWRCEKKMPLHFCFWVCKLDTSSNFEFTPTFHNDYFYFVIVVTPRWGIVYLNEHHHCRWGATCAVYKKLILLSAFELQCNREWIL